MTTRSAGRRSRRDAWARPAHCLRSRAERRSDTVACAFAWTQRRADRAAYGRTALEIVAKRRLAGGGVAFLASK
jgi:hypothetical protein